MKEIKHPSKRIDHVLEVPNLIELQLNSYKWFLREGLPELLKSFSPIWDFTHTNYIEFGEFSLGEPKYTVDECRDRDVTFEAPLKVKVSLGPKDMEVIESEVYLGDLPIMTDSGTFIINGRERVIVSQLSRSPGIYFDDDVDLTMQILTKARVIPNEGPWLELESEPNFVVRAAISQSKKIPVTQLIKALNAFENARQPVTKVLSESIHRRLAEPLADPETGEVLGAVDTLITEEFVASLPKGLRDTSIRIYSPVGTNDDLLYTFGKRLSLKKPTATELYGKRPIEDIKEGGELIVAKLKRIDRETSVKLGAMELKTLEVLEVNPFIDATIEHDNTKTTKDALLEYHKGARPGETPNEETAKTHLNGQFFDKRRYDLARVGRRQINRRLKIDVPATARHLTVEDLVECLLYMTRLRDGQAEGDDIDHLQNKRVRSVGEVLLSQMRTGFVRMEKVARERMTSAEQDNLMPGIILSVKPVSASIKSFFSSNQLSTFMDQTNPLSALTNKRRLSSLGPGGLQRNSAKLEVRDVHRSHYGRICPIETPEGPNIGLISQLTVYARVDEFGLIQTPFRVVKDGKVSSEIVYLAAGEDDDKRVAPADVPFDETGAFVAERVQVRFRGSYPVVAKAAIDYMDVSPVQIISVATSCIPFLENDDANRALMGANMQRQAVPLLRSDRPMVGTGYERRAALDSGASIVARSGGTVSSVTAEEIVVESFDGVTETHHLDHMRASNKSTCITHRPIVFPGQYVAEGQALADGPTCDEGRLALGKNLLVAFMPWGGYNYEDAILISERMVKDDVLTSIHIERHDTEAVDTKLGPEEITRDIPNVGEDALRDLDETGIVRIGAQVRPEDILVGKVAPKGQQEMTAEERLIVAIFGKKAEETRDVSLRVPHGEHGTIVDVKVFSRFRYEGIDTGKVYNESKKRERLVSDYTGEDLRPISPDELNTGTNMKAHVFVAQKRKIMEGDKMAGRHGNKGVISKIVPVEDMPMLADGTAVDIVLNPLGVPSRMNIGQILETHLGLAGERMGVRYICPAFEGSTEEEIMSDLRRMDELTRQNVMQAYVNQELGLGLEFDGVASVEEMVNEIEKALRKLGQSRLEEVSRIVAAEPVMSVTQMDPDAEWIVDDNEPTHKASDSVYKSLIESIRQNVWDRTGFVAESGKSIIRDGLTGDIVPNPITVGIIYMLKLEHLAEEKSHARSIGPYSLVTQQPLGGKAQFGGQRFGEMEVWALEAYGAAATLQEILTIKSDDVMGRVKTYESIVRGDTMLEPGIPESFKILVNELRSLCLKVVVEDANHREIDLRNLDDPGPSEDMRLARSVGFF
ncbi:MAG: DNA-directed RNA polymerase subunit beta [Armatimonadota bacterium]|nr:DNA-directed RNA polymerase subunit beta [Armatimonadota bacterium]